MESLLYRLQNWVRTAAQFKNNCNVYYKNEKIFSCKNCTEAEQHIKRMYNTVASRLSTIDDSHNNDALHTEETTNWKKFRNSFKIDSGNQTTNKLH